MSLHQGRSRYSAREGRGDWEGEERRKQQRNSGACNQHPLVLPTRHRRNKQTRKGGGGGGEYCPEVLLQLLGRPAPPLFPIWSWGLFRRLFLLLVSKLRLRLFKAGQAVGLM